MEFGASPETDKPGPVFLEYAFARITERITESVETGFGGIGLETAVVEFHGVFINLSNEVPVEEDLRNSVCRFDPCVVLAPVLVCLDGGVHLGFDFTHEKRKGLERVAGVVPSTSIQYTVLRSKTKPCGTSPTVTCGLCCAGLFRYALA